MKKEEFRNSTLTAKIFDFFVLGSTFFVTCSILSVQVGKDVLILAFAYSWVITLSVSIGKHFISRSFSSLSDVLKLMLSNASGLMIGVSIMLILGIIVPGLSNFSVVIIIASVMAFFVLGTLSPLIVLDKRTHP